MDITNLVSPITSSYWHKTQFSYNESSFNGNLDFFGDLHSESDMTILVSDSNYSLKSGSLSSLGLFLDGYDLHDLIGKLFLALFD